ncbi:MAG TPA: cysteine hydrolase family protein [Trinickia sp.]|uniref:cysteine hydrolase family protein n=1 Tax=Trinickia sp. TaxID=2571163 RepID=UPI002BBB98D1|nr:cysteine hydrolase family protein [Trinickia sp.]HVW52642.1 cysteine hydrolase family protein [Trinickia sp.]
MPQLAVIVIDMQRRLLAGDGSPEFGAAHRVPQVIAGINRLTSAARAAGAPVCFVQHEGEGLANGTAGWQLHEGLETDLARDWFVEKRVGDSFQDTPLKSRLDAEGVTRLLACGYASQYCVDTTARRAALLGFETTVVADLHTTQPQGSLSAADIIAHRNEVWATSSLSGNRIAVRELADILTKEFA